MKNNKGFSLIELMVVVAIIGILASIAVPNFQRFQRRARQSEARTQLGALYTAEIAFQAEYRSYYSGVDAIGYAPAGIMNYNVGFTTVNSPTAASINLLQPVTLAASAVSNSFDWCALAVSNCTMAVDHALAGSVNPTVTTFTAASAGPLGGTLPLDEWTVTQGKLFVNTINGL